VKLRSALCLGAMALPPAALAAPETYSMDPQHSFLHFDVAYGNGTSKLSGRFDRVTGKFVIDRAAGTGRLDVAVQAASITTGDVDKGGRPHSRDGHLRSPDFLDVAEFPTMTFKSTKVLFKDDAPSRIEGNMTLLGVTRPVTFAVDHWKCAPQPATGKMMCGANAYTTIRRSDFGMKFGIPAIADEQSLWIEVHAYRD